MYETIAAVIFAATAQFTFCWRFHSVYIKLHGRFKTAVDDIAEKRRRKYRESLKNLFEEIQKAIASSRGSTPPNVSEFLAANPEYDGKITNLSYLISFAAEPHHVYRRTRDSARTIHKYLLVSGILTLFGLIPALLNLIVYSFLFFIFLFPLTAAIIAWREFSDAERALVEIRDRGE